MTGRPLSSTRRHDLATTATNLATWLTTNEAATVMRLITEAIDGTPYPSKTSTAPRQPHNQVDADGYPIPPDTPTEARALTPDPIGQQAAALANDLHQLHELTASVWRRLQSWQPSRTLALYACGHPVTDRNYSRCQYIDPDTGIQCGQGHTQVRSCKTCDRLIQPGEYYSNRQCRTCYDAERRPTSSNTSGRWFTTDDLQLTDGVMISDIQFDTDSGAAHA